MIEIALPQIYASHIAIAFSRSHEAPVVEMIAECARPLDRNGQEMSFVGIMQLQWFLFAPTRPLWSKWPQNALGHLIELVKKCLSLGKKHDEW